MEQRKGRYAWPGLATQKQDHVPRRRAMAALARLLLASQLHAAAAHWKEGGRRGACALRLLANRRSLGQRGRDARLDGLDRSTDRGTGRGCHMCASRARRGKTG